MHTLNIVGLGGSHSDFSASLYALKIALSAAEATGCNTQLFDIEKLDLPFFDTRSTIIPAKAQHFCDSLYAADALIWASPLYHGSVSGAFKNAIDWLELLSSNTPKYLSQKPVGLIATAGGTQGLQAINTMEYMVRALRGFTIPLVVPVSNAWDIFTAEGAITDQKVAQQLEALGQEVASTALLMRP